MAEFTITLPDRPGALAQLAARFRQADISLVGMWGRGGDPEADDQGAVLSCIPESPDQFRNFALSAELEFEEGQAFFLAGRSGGASLVETLEKIARAGINLQAIQGVRRGEEFGCFIWADPDDWPKLAEVLGAESTAGAEATRR